MNWFTELLEEIFKKPVYATDPMPTPQPIDPDALLSWDTKENCRHNVRALCDLEGLTVDQKNDFSRTIHCESDYNPECVHPNIVNGHVSSTDYGIAQINDYWHIGPGKDFATIADAMNPENAIRWACRQWKAGNGKLWVCKLKNLNLNYSP